MNRNIPESLTPFHKQVQPLHGLPSWAYADENFWQLECDTLLQDNWVFAGLVHELQKPGDVVPVMVAGKPLFLIKNKSGEIAAFHNVCRHRCMTLVDKPKNVSRFITCPYHAWTYDLDGELVATPFFGGKESHGVEGFDAKQNGLLGVRVAVWYDWIFVNLGGKAIPFEEYSAPLRKRLDMRDFSQMKPLATLDFGVIKTNWKFIMENFIEPYHVQFVHRTTTNQPLTDHYTIVDGPCLGSGVDLDEATGVDGSLGVSSSYLTLFPNFIIGRYFPEGMPTQLGVYLNIPLSAGRMAQKRIIYTTGEQDLTQEEIENLKKLWWDVHKEDHEICEGMQLGRNSPVAINGGVLSPHWENSVRAFQELVVQAVSQSQKTRH